MMAQPLKDILLCSEKICQGPLVLIDHSCKKSRVIERLKIPKDGI